MDNKNMHIMFLADELGSSKGGLSTINRELAKHFAKLPNVRVSFLVPPSQDTNDAKKEAESYGINLAVAGQGYVCFDDHVSLCFPPENLGHIDVVVGHGRKLGPPAQPIKASKQCKWVQFVHVSSEDIGMYKGIADNERKHKMELALCTAADLVVAVGPKLAETYTDQLLYPERRYVHTFTPGIFEEFTKLPTARPKSKFKILMFGRGAAEEFDVKGYRLAAKAIASLGRGYHLNFVGAPKGEHSPKVKELLERDIPTSQLTVRSFCTSRVELSKMFCEAHLAIMPSQTEGFGLAALEAMSAGVPVLVSSNSGLGQALQHKEILHHDSFLIDPDKPDALQDKIKGVREKDHKTRLEEAEALRSNYEKAYPWAEECKNLHAEIRKLFQQKCQ